MQRDFSTSTKSFLLSPYTEMRLNRMFRLHFSAFVINPSLKLSLKFLTSMSMRIITDSIALVLGKKTVMLVGFGMLSIHSTSYLGCLPRFKLWKWSIPQILGIHSPPANIPWNECRKSGSSFPVSDTTPPPAFPHWWRNVRLQESPRVVLGNNCYTGGCFNFELYQS